MQDTIFLQNYDNLIEVLVKEHSIDISTFLEILDNYNDFETNFELCKAFGIPLLIEDSNIRLKSKNSIFDCEFCIVDIETTGFSPKDNEIIEIGAIKYHNGNIVDKFESYIFCSEIPPKITEITGIESKDTINAPKLNIVLERFKIFLNDCIFIAHNAIFDFNFINGKLEQVKLPVMKNRVLCSLQLARKTILAQKYGLEYLNEFLGINYPLRHRAYADCIIALKVFEMSILNLPFGVCNAEDLISFSKGKKF